MVEENFENQSSETLQNQRFSAYNFDYGTKYEESIFTEQKDVQKSCYFYQNPAKS